MKTSIRKSVTKTHQSNSKKVVMKGKLILIAVCLILASYGIAGADYVLVDQANMSNVDSWHNLSYYKFDQEFTPSVSSMDMVALELNTNEESAALRVYIREREDGLIIGTSDDLVLRPGFTGMARFVFASPVKLHRGSTYVIDLELLSPGSAFVASGFEGGGYPQGLMYITYINNGNTVTETDNYSDLIFQTGNVRSKNNGK